ncbi:MAG TPA: hypothetical protein VLC47_05770 [Burkholderiales bacterium]|nr:hypothetical protein [Burkholderiales bacterium]
MNTEERARALLALVDEYRDSKSGEILDAAREDARAVVAQAFRLARSRVHEALVEERKRYEAAVAGAEARLRTRRRLAHQGREAAMLADGWRLLPDALRERWHSAAGRRRWAETHLGRGLATLPRTEWEIAHARGWTQDERQAAAGWLGAHGGPELAFAEDASLGAGFRVSAGHNTLDATLEGLLADRRAIEGRLLHHLEQDAGEQE